MKRKISYPLNWPNSRKFWGYYYNGIPIEYPPLFKEKKMEKEMTPTNAAVEFARATYDLERATKILVEIQEKLKIAEALSAADFTNDTKYREADCLYNEYKNQREIVDDFTNARLNAWAIYLKVCWGEK